MYSPTDSATNASPSAAEWTIIPCPLRLRFRGGQHDGQVVRINSSKCTIGSSDQATLRLACAGVHPVHCVILIGTEATAVRRLAPDTLLNGVVFEDEQLRPGDVLTLGPLYLEVLPADAPQPTAEQAVAGPSELPQTTSSGEGTPITDQVTDPPAAYDHAVTMQLGDLQRDVAETPGCENPSLSFEELQAMRGEIEAIRHQLEQERIHNQQLAEQLANVTGQIDVEPSTAIQPTAPDPVCQTMSIEALRLQQLSEQGSHVNQLLQDPPQSLQGTESPFEPQPNLDGGNTVGEPLADNIQNTIVWPPEQAFGDAEQSQHNNVPPNAFQLDQQSDAHRSEELQANAPQPIIDGAQDSSPYATQGLPPQDASLGQAEAAPTTTNNDFDTPNTAAPVEPPSPAATQPEPFHAAPATPIAPELTTSTEPAEPTNQTMAFEQAAPFADVPQNDANSMLDKLRAELRQSCQPAADEPQPPLATTSETPPEPAQEAPAETVEAYEPTGPTVPEEIEYSEPDRAAPVDTSAILAKFGHAVEELELEEPTPPPVAQPTPMPSSEDDEEDDESIQDYMAQLMRRVGSDATESNEATPKKPASVANPAPKKVEPQPVTPPKAEPAPKPLDPSEFVPRAVAPEATSGLKALRAVANTSTRSAIDRHRRRSLDTKAIISGFIALVAFGVSVAMGYLALDAVSLISIPTFLCLFSGFIGVLAAVKALAYSATAALSSRRQQNLKQLSAR